MTHRSRMATKRIRSAVTALVGVLAMGSMSVAIAFPTLDELYEQCLAEFPEGDREGCCLGLGGQYIEILDPKNEEFIEAVCVFAKPAPDPKAPLPPVPAPDRSAPDTTVDSGPKAQIKRHEATFLFSAEPNATFACSLDGADFSACTSPLTLTGLRRGEHVLQVAAIDEAGNHDASPAVSSFKVIKTRKR
jgi:hypothetical protein